MIVEKQKLTMEERRAQKERKQKETEAWVAHHVEDIMIPVVAKRTAGEIITDKDFQEFAGTKLAEKAKLYPQFKTRLSKVMDELVRVWIENYALTLEMEAEILVKKIVESIKVQNLLDPSFVAREELRKYVIGNYNLARQAADKLFKNYGIKSI